jgi:hypothetical protein
MSNVARAALLEMQELRDGERLARAARALERQLPREPLALMSTSVEGAALAAVCATSRDLDATWQLVNLLNAPPVPDGRRPVMIEPVDPGEGWRHAVLDRYPNALVMTQPELLEAAA